MKPQEFYSTKVKCYNFTLQAFQTLFAFVYFGGYSNQVENKSSYHHIIETNIIEYTIVESRRLLYAHEVLSTDL